MLGILNPKDNNPKIWSWFLIHILFPFLPFILGGTIRLGLHWQLTIDTFRATELAICLAFLSILVYQSLLRNERLLDNEDKKKDVEGMATLFLIFAVILIAFYSVGIALDCFSDHPEIQIVQNGKTFVSLLVYVFGIVITIASISIQKSYKLRGGAI